MFPMPVAQRAIILGKLAEMAAEADDAARTVQCLADHGTLHKLDDTYTCSR